jgi:transcriptional regulator with GAF, ATPase, and Fis domain
VKINKNTHLYFGTDFAISLKEGTKMGTLKDKIKEMEKEEIINALGECNWVMAKAARKLGITERMIGYKIRKYGIRKGAGDQPVNEGL